MPKNTPHILDVLRHPTFIGHVCFITGTYYGTSGGSLFKHASIYEAVRSLDTSIKSIKGKKAKEICRPDKGV